MKKDNNKPFATVTTTSTVSFERMQDLLCTAFEGCSYNWIDKIECHSDKNYKGEKPEYVYYIPLLTKGHILIHIIEDDFKPFKLTTKALKKGLDIFAEKYPKAFAEFINENEDGETADIFLQCCCFGEIVYE